MNTIDYFMKFYNSLDTLELVLLWVGIFVFLIIIFFSVYLYIKNKQLISVIKEQKDELENKNLNIIKEIDKDNKIEKKENSVDSVTREDNKKIEKKIDDKVYNNNNKLKSNYSRYQTSPIDVSVNNKNKVEKKENISFTEELSNKIAEEIKPQTIELTEFEKKQEEEAIISYHELLTSSKDKVYNITDDDETTDFIKELKSFRSNL